MELLPGLLPAFGVLEIGGAEEIDRVPGLLEFRGEDLAGLDGGDGEGDEGRGHVPVQEGPGHRVLAADGGGAVVQLGVQSAQQCGKGLAPAIRLRAELLEKFLKRQIGVPVIRTRSHQLGHGGVYLSLIHI